MGDEYIFGPQGWDYLPHHWLEGPSTGPYFWIRGIDRDFYFNADGAAVYQDDEGNEILVDMDDDDAYLFDWPLPWEREETENPDCYWTDTDGNWHYVRNNLQDTRFSLQDHGTPTGTGAMMTSRRTAPASTETTGSMVKSTGTCARSEPTWSTQLATCSLLAARPSALPPTPRPPPPPPSVIGKSWRTDTPSEVNPRSQFSDNYSR